MKETKMKVEPPVHLIHNLINHKWYRLRGSVRRFLHKQDDRDAQIYEHVAPA